MRSFNFFYPSLLSLCVVGCASLSFKQNQVNREFDQTVHWESLRLGLAGKPLTERPARMDGFLQVIEANGYPVGFFLWETKEAMGHGGVPYRSIAIDADSFMSAVRTRYAEFDKFIALQGDLVSVVGTLRISGGPLLGDLRELTHVFLSDQEQREYDLQFKLNDVR